MDHCLTVIMPSTGSSLFFGTHHMINYTWGWRAMPLRGPLQLRVTYLSEREIFWGTCHFLCLAPNREDCVTQSNIGVTQSDQTLVMTSQMFLFPSGSVKSALIITMWFQVELHGATLRPVISDCWWGGVQHNCHSSWVTDMQSLSTLCCLSITKYIKVCL